MKLIVDITELSDWQGKLTGVPRVMQELASRFENEQDVVLVKWEGLIKAYVAAELSNQGDKQPESSARPLTARAIKKLARSNNLTRHIAAKFKEKHTNWKGPIASTTSLQVIPSKGDVLFVLADWHGADGNFIDYLSAQKTKGVKLVQICYDMLPVVTPQYSGHSTGTFKEYTKRIHPICDLIVAISQNTKKDIEQWLTLQKLHVPPVKVFRLGDDFKKEKPKEPQSKKVRTLIEHKTSFLLCVGTIEARKNHTLLYYSYKLAKERAISLPPLVIAGRRGWKTEDVFDVINMDPDVNNQIIFLEGTSSASDEELSWLYQNCLFSIYPSFYEGWGLPIAESIAYGTPCISSNTSSMSEVAGDIITYFSPSSTDECLAAIIKMMQPKELKRAKDKIKQYNTVTWDDTFIQIKAYLEQVKNGK